MSKLQTKLPTDTWVTASWDEYIQAINDPTCAKAFGYYNNGQLRIEMSPLGNDHSRDHTIIIFAVNLFATIKGIPLNGNDNCTYRKTGLQEAQPDVSYYIGSNADAIPWGTSIVDLDIYPTPNLVIEVAKTSLADDRKAKRLLYEAMAVDEYWIVDVDHVEVIAFTIKNQSSQRITDSLVLPGITVSLLEEVLRRSRRMNQMQVGAWLLAHLQQ